MRLDLQRSGEEAVVSAAGRLTVSQAGYLHQALVQAFEGARRVELALRDIREADLSFLQLLCAAHRTAAAQGAVFAVGGLAGAEPVLRLIREAGAERGVGCPEGCLWPGAAAGGGAALAGKE